MPGTEGHIIPSIRLVRLNGEDAEWSTGDKEIRRSPNSPLTALRAVRQQVNRKMQTPRVVERRLHLGFSCCLDAGRRPASTGCPGLLTSDS